MATRVFDPATATLALAALAERCGDGGWSASTRGSSAVRAQQFAFLDWCRYSLEAAAKLTGIKIKVSDDAAVLNAFLVNNGFDPMFDPFGSRDVGAAAVLDLLVRWKAVVEKTTMVSLDRCYPALSVPATGVEIFDVTDQQELLIKIATADGGAVWLMMASEPQTDVAMLKFVYEVMRNRKPAADASSISAVIVPTLDIDAVNGLDWLLDISCGDYYVRQTFQMLRLKLDSNGAHVRVAGGFKATRSCRPASREILFNRPFTVWLTQPDSEVPIAICFADRDVWKNPSQGVLGDDCDLTEELDSDGRSASYPWRRS